MEEKTMTLEEKEQIFLNSCREGNIDIVKHYLKSNKQRNREMEMEEEVKEEKEEEKIPLMVACQNKQLEVVQLLLNSEKINVNQVNQVGATTLLLNCAKGEVEIVKLLLKCNRIDVNQGTISGSTPLLEACRNDHYEVVRELLKHKKINVNQANSSGVSPFFLCCQLGNLVCLKQLMLDPRTDVNLLTDAKESPFLIACQNNNVNVVQILLCDERIEVNVANHPHKNGFSVACEHAHFELVKELLDSSRIDLQHVDSRVYLRDFQLLQLVLASGKKINDSILKNVEHRYSKLDILLKSFKKDPKTVRTQIIFDLGMQDQKAADIFSLVVFLSDDYFKLQMNQKDNISKQMRRFFFIAKKLPLELQMILCYRVVSSKKQNLLSSEIERAFFKLTRKILGDSLSQPTKTNIFSNFFGIFSWKS